MLLKERIRKMMAFGCTDDDICDYLDMTSDEVTAILESGCDNE